MNFLKTIINLFKDNLANIILALCGAVKAFFTYKNNCIQNKEEKNKEKKCKKFEKEIDEITKKGSLDDLLDLKRT